MFNTLTRMGAAGAGGDYEIEQSLRFNRYSSPKLTFTPSSTTNSKTFTLSFWFKVGRIESTNTTLFEGNTTNANGFVVQLQSDATLYLYDHGVFQIWSLRKFRDHAAWYHCVIAFDTTQATDTNRVKVYINGVQEDLSTWSLGSGANRYPDQNDDLDINQTNEMAIGESGWTGGNDHWDGYIAEFHSVDGTQLTAASFGETNAVTGQWVPIKYAGAHGTNGFYLNFAGDSLNNAFVDSSSNARTVTTVGNAVHSTAQEKIGASSIRRPSSPNSCIHVPDSSDFDWGTNDWTLECWVRRDAQGADEWLMAHSDGTGANTSIGLHIWSSSVANSNKVNIRMRQSSSNLNCTGTTELAANTWYHVAGVRDGNTLRLYINGVQENTTSISGSPDTSSAPFAFTALRSNGDAGLTGYMDEIRVSNNCRYTSGTSFTPSTSAFSSDGNTLVLIHSDFTGTDIAADASSNSNNWQANTAISITAGVNNDVLEDSPTNNFCTVNPLAGRKNEIIESQDGLLYSPFEGGTYQTACATQAFKSGKWYWEVTTNLVGSQTNLGVCLATWDQNDIPLEAWRNYQNNGNKNTCLNGTNTATSSWGATFTDGDVIGIAVDMSAGTITFYKNGSSQGAAYSDLASAMPDSGWLPFGNCSAGSWYWNFGQRPFAHTPPADHLKLCSANIPEPTIKNGTDNFNTVFYTGNNGTNAITGVGFQPDLFWIKDRSTTGEDHHLFDAVRGLNKALYTNQSSAESDGFDGGTQNNITAVGADGFTITGNGSNGEGNLTGRNYVAWNWKESAPAGFDIVSWTGNATNRTISHSLGVAPEMILVKNRTDDEVWKVYNKDMGNTKFLMLNQDTAEQTESGNWNDTTPTSSVISIGTDNAVNGNNDSIIAYCFASVEGYSSVGSYKGNNDDFGPFIYTGFKPAWLMIKMTTAADSWAIFDNKRTDSGGGNVIDKHLRSDTTGADHDPGGDPPVEIDFVSNGFKHRNNSNQVNGANTYIYLAFAESPFKYATAR